jgi:hypothetical protein
MRRGRAHKAYLDGITKGDGIASADWLRVKLWSLGELVLG